MIILHAIINNMLKEKYLISSLRLSIGFIFIWAFLDKTFGLGFATTSAKAWINGGSPTTGFLSFAVKGPFADIFHSLAGVALVDWLFMLGLLFVGVTLLTKKLVEYGCMAGILMLLLMYLALVLPENNPIVDEHIVYIIVLLLVAIKSEDKINTV